MLPRLAVAVYLIVTAVFSIQATAAQAPHLSRERLVAELTQTPLATVACVLALWFPKTGAIVGLAALLLSLVQQPTGTDFFFVLLVTPITFTATRTRHRTVLVLASIHVCYAIAQAARASDPVAVFAQYIAWLTIAYGTGLVVRQLAQARMQGLSRINRLFRENESIAAVERSRLADELGLIVSTALAGLHDAVEQARKRTAPGADRSDRSDRWDEFDRLSRDTLAELRRLVGVLREDSPSSRHGSPGRAGERAVSCLRPVTTIGFGVLTYVQLATVSGHVGEIPIALLAMAAAITLMWWPRWGLVLMAITLISALATGSQVPSLLGLLLVAPAILATTSPGSALSIAVGLGAGYVVMLTAGGDESTAATVFAGSTLVTGVVVGVVAAHYLASRRRALSRLAELEREREAALVAERCRLARELHDVIAYQLTLVSLQVMAHAGCQDPAEREAALQVIEQATSSAQRDLALLIHVMDGNPAALASAPVDTDLLTPTAVAAGLASILQGHGHPTTVEVPTAADQCSPMIRRTLSRTMQESATNALRYSPPNTPCALALVMSADTITLRFTSQVGTRARTTHLSSGFGLRGIRERVALTGGTFFAGPSQGRWVVSVALPLT